MPNKEFAIFINADGIGRGDEGLGRRQMVKFLGELCEVEAEALPGFICLMNGGVKLACHLDVPPDVGVGYKPANGRVPDPPLQTTTGSPAECHDGSAGSLEYLRKLADTGVEHLKKLSDAGVEILVCGTCLEFFGLKENVAVGRVSNITEITTVLAKAAKVLTV